MTPLNRQQDLAEIEARAAELKGRMTQDAVRVGFMSRTLEAELGAIGQLALSSRGSADVFVDAHILVWTGYEIVMDSDYRSWF